MNRTVKVAAAASSGKLAGKLAGRLAGMVVGLFAAVALAAEVGGVKLDDKLSMGAQELVLNGAGIRTRVVFKVLNEGLAENNTAAELAAVKSQVDQLATIVKIV
jgi:Chalcone isomerase-like